MSRRRGLSTAELRAMSALRRAGREAEKALYAAAKAERSQGASRERYERQAERARARAVTESDRADRILWKVIDRDFDRQMKEQERALSDAAVELPQEQPQAVELPQEGPQAVELPQEGPQAVELPQVPMEAWGEWIQPGPNDGVQRPPDSLFEPVTSRYGEAKAMKPEVIAQGDLDAVREGIDRIQAAIGHSLMVPGGTLHLPNGESVKVPTEIAMKGGEAVQAWVREELVNRGERADDDEDPDAWYFEVDELRYAY